jgi:hypothetical protein
MVEKSSYYTALSRMLQGHERAALKAFNKEVSFHAMVSDDLAHARVMAIGNLNEPVMMDLARAFQALYPHWFTNGRGSMIKSEVPAKYQQVCLEVVGKLNKASGRKFADILRLFDLSGDHAMATGRRPLAHTDPGQGHKRIRTVMRRTHCKYHSDKVVVARDLCAQCYNRMNSLGRMEIFVELLPVLAMKEIMLAPRPSKSMPLYRVAQEIIKKHEEAGNV